MTLKKIIRYLRAVKESLSIQDSPVSFYKRATSSLVIWIFMCIYALTSLLRVNAYDNYNISVNKEISTEYRFSDTVVGHSSVKSSDNLSAAAQMTLDRYNNASKSLKNCAGWINIPKTRIDYPLMFYSDNSYYLEHDPFGREDKAGSIFIDKDCEDWSGLVLIHGHHMKDGSMFGDLENYMDTEFANDNKYVYTVENGVSVKYRIFSIFTLDASKEGIDVSFSNNSELHNYVMGLYNRSFIKMDAPSSDKVIVLNTCSYNYENAHLIVCAAKESL